MSLKHWFRHAIASKETGDDAIGRFYSFAIVIAAKEII